MKTQTATTRRCPACRKADLAPSEYVREFHPHGKTVSVTLLTSHCPSCGADATSATQHSENLGRLRARKAEYGGLLMGEEILALRRRYGITQQVAAKIFGKGKIAFSRYENETSYPDATATKLLKQAMQNPRVIKSLADDADVTLPLWDARCDEEQKSKVRLMADVREPAADAAVWARGPLPTTTAQVVSTATIWTLLLEGFSNKVEMVAVNEDRFDSLEEAYG